MYSTLKYKSTAFYSRHLGFLHSLPFHTFSLHIELIMVVIWWWNQGFYFLFDSKACFSTFYIELLFTPTAKVRVNLIPSPTLVVFVVWRPTNISYHGHVRMDPELWLCTHGDFRGNQATSTITWYPTQSHYPDTKPTSPCTVLIMPSA